ncbi:uncharacterized protein [Mytilus edulis]|uniref:uncharacterized protein n=1 Tax=Mytilus edulis TaxID=6550 RepID=UPI0039EE11FF
MICAACLPESHSNHKFQEIEEAFDQKLAEIKSVKEKTNKQFQVIERDTETFEKFLSCVDESYNNEAFRILYKYSLLHKFLDQKSTALINSLQDAKKEAGEQISKEKALLQEHKQILSLRTEKIDKTLISLEPEKVFSILHEIENVNLPTYNINVGKRLNFNSLLHQTTIPDLDFISQIETTRQQVSTKFNIVEKYVLDIQGKLAGVSFCKNDHTMAWIYDDQNTLRKIKFAKNGMKFVKGIQVQVQDISIDAGGTLFILEKDSTEIKTLPKKNGMKTFLDMSPYYPISIHITKDNEIIVGLIKDKECKVVVLLRSGEKKREFEITSKDEMLFSFPCKIATNSKGHIWVLDCPPGSKGRIVIIKKDGCLKFITDANNPKEDFCPADITSTSTGHVIVLNSKYHRLCVFTEDGDYLAHEYLSSFKKNIDMDNSEMIASNIPKFPEDFSDMTKYLSFALCIDSDSNGLLLVGSENINTKFAKISTDLCLVKIETSKD